MITRRGYVYCVIACCFAFAACRGKKTSTTDINPDNKTLPFDQGGRIVSKYFTGEVHLNMLVDADSIYNMNVGNVSFQRGARTNWHSHPGGQILMVTSGTGFYQEKDKPKHIIKAGDIIKCAPNVLHWHGATPEDTMTHIAIGPNLNKGSVSWQEAVTDSVYHSVLK
ncbi:Cupin domain protein [Chitinophaga sp. YR627]|uniref:cupin domain-containing protein n=1 Tax=Chitinophaga sp. YR627 TaxID=1881041 RepID=UPI0008F15AFF|nr:cupin domain-containing protein [Chitinophaga sp. YR627]SFO87353.1 Cupin domain protein [Chitinophaga sp. YR627]